MNETEQNNRIEKHIDWLVVTLFSSLRCGYWPLCVVRNIIAQSLLFTPLLAHRKSLQHPLYNLSLSGLLHCYIIKQWGKPTQSYARVFNHNMPSCKNWEVHDRPAKRRATSAKFDDIFGVLSNVLLAFLFIKHFHYEIIEFCKCNVVLILQIMAPVRVKMEDKVLYVPLSSNLLSRH